MRLYFACGGKQEIGYLIEKKGVKNILFSYAYVKDCSFLTKYKGIHFLVDSGAFTAWTKGKQVDIDAYIEYIKEEIEPLRKYNNVNVINLDVIPGQFGKKPTIEERELSARKGLENYLYMKRKGIETIHTYHMYEKKEVLDEIKKYCKYIGISPANDASVVKRLEWLKWVFYDLRTDYKTHILGLTADVMLKQIPVYSADSSSWQSGTMWGRAIDVKDKGLEKFITERGKKERSWNHNVEKILKKEDFYTKLWEKRGVKWES